MTRSWVGDARALSARHLVRGCRRPRARLLSWASVAEGGASRSGRQTHHAAGATEVHVASGHEARRRRSSDHGDKSQAADPLPQTSVSCHETRVRDLIRRGAARRRGSGPHYAGWCHDRRQTAPQESSPAIPGAEPGASPRGTAYEAALEVIASVEPRIAEATRAELADQRASLKLIASENYASPAVLLTMGTWFSDKYAEGTVGHRFYAGCQNVDTVEALAAEHARELFGRRVRLRPAALRHRRQPGRVLVDPGPPGREPRAGEALGQERQRADRGRLGGRCATSSATSGCSGCRWTPAAT